MSSVPSIAKLPIPILRELVERLQNSYEQSQTLTDHVNWLSQKGCKVSRSRLHVFCKELRKIKLENPDGADILNIYLWQKKEAYSIL